MTDIPEDIFAIARTLADDAANFGYTQAALDIARAILAERERCWKIADDEDDRSPCNPAAAVARRIRTPAELQLNTVQP